MSSMASANLWEVDTETAYQLTKKATALAGRSSFHHWWDTFHCISCIASGRYEEAIKFGESAARVTLNFRPLLRYLLALYAHMWNREKMWDMVVALKRLEPDFSLDKFKFDESYPVRTLRRANLLLLQSKSHNSLAFLTCCANAVFKRGDSAWHWKMRQK